MRPFRPSLRDTLTRLMVLAGTSWLVLRLVMRMDVRMATVMTVGALGVMVAMRIALRGRHTELATDNDGLRVRGPDGERAIAWRAMESVRLASGSVSTATGVVRVCYAQIEVAHGPPIAFADLSSMAGARLRTAEGDAPVYDVGDPELLLGTIAERLDAREFLPGTAASVEGAVRAPWLAASPLTTLRLGLMVLLGVRGVGLLHNTDDVLAALGGAGAVCATHALTRFVAQWKGGLSQSEVGAPPALATGALLAVGLSALGAWVPPDVRAWTLVAALALALPAWPLPGGYLARRLGRSLAELEDPVVALSVAALGVLVAWLFACGMVILPTALVAGGLECADGFKASRRHAHLASLPRFRSLAPEAIASYRALLRPLAPNEDDATLGPIDIVEIRLASVTPPPASVVPMVVALVGIALVGLVAHGSMHGLTGSAARVLQSMLS